MKTKLKYILATGFGLYGIVSFGHDIPVHQAITANAAASAYANSPAYVSFINTISSDLFYTGFKNSATNAMIQGSGFEDGIFAKGDISGIRPLNHFYDPLDSTYGKGLSDSPSGFYSLLFASPLLFPLSITGDARILVGTNSFAWASSSNCAGINLPIVNPHPANTWSWQNAGLEITKNERLNI